MCVCIRQLRLYRLRLPLLQPWRTAYGEEHAVETVLAKAISEDAEAWVESCPLAAPLFSPETAGTVFHMVGEYFGPYVIDRQLSGARDVPQLFADCRGNSFAKSLLDLCWWALVATRQGVPLRTLFGGGDEPVPVADGVGLQESPEALVAKVGEAVAHGARRVKVKLQSSRQLPALRAAREAFAELPLSVDCNGCFTLEDLPFFRELDELGLVMIEQPLYWRDLLDHSRLQKQLRTPLCLDESIASYKDAEAAIRAQACRVVNIKIGRVGGLGEALAIRELCHRQGLGCWVGSMLESCLGTAINAELATAFDGTYAHEIPYFGRFHAGQVLRPPVLVSHEGLAYPGQGPYLGREVDEDRVRQFAVAEDVIEGS